MHYLANSDKESMLFNFFKAQWDFPARKTSVSDYDLPCNFEYFERKSKAAFKKIIDKKSKELASDKFIKFRASHSKMKNLQYDELKLQKYLKLSELTVEEIKHLLLWRTRMTKFGKNYGEGDKLCVLCQSYPDSQEESFLCNEAKKVILYKKL